MIAPITKRTDRSSPPAWHPDFLEMLPAIETHAKVAFRNLDPEARRVFFQLLAEKQEHTAMLISSHRLDEVASLVNRVIEMDQGLARALLEILLKLLLVEFPHRILLGCIDDLPQAEARRQPHKGGEQR
mgnify:CR=1 FL=1